MGCGGVGGWGVEVWVGWWRCGGERGWGGGGVGGRGVEVWGERGWWGGVG